MTQLTLGIQLTEELTFANYYPDANQQIVSMLKQACLGHGDKVIYLHGQPAVGKTHLLQASCYKASVSGKRAAYIPCRDHKKLSSLIFEGLENLNLVCLDDIEMIAGLAAWEEAIFHLYNRIQLNEARLIVTSLVPPQQLQFNLADLVSRLASANIFRIKPLNDQEKIITLQMRAKSRGLELPAEVGNYLIHHCPRNMHALFRTLEKLDHASLAAQRKLTVPFVKDVLDVHP